jgi:hypothetical protein
MGYRVLLVAVTGKASDRIWAEYSVTPTNEFWATPEPPVSGTTLPSGAYLLYIWDQISPGDQVFSRLATNASLLACYANETTMSSRVCSWVNGTEKWSVFHDSCHHGVQHIEVTGDIPDELQPIQEKGFRQQRDLGDADYVFGIPIDLFAALGGIRYDDDIEFVDPKPWQILRRIATSSIRRHWWWPFR